MKSLRFDDYRDRYECVSMRREDGILEVVIHAKGAPDKPCLWSNAPHEEPSFAFCDIARDRQNRCVILTGAGDAFCADMHPSVSGLSRFSQANKSLQHGCSF